MFIKELVCVQYHPKVKQLVVRSYTIYDCLLLWLILLSEPHGLQGLSEQVLAPEPALLVQAVHQGKCNRLEALR